MDEVRKAIGVWKRNESGSVVRVFRRLKQSALLLLAVVVIAVAAPAKGEEPMSKYVRKTDNAALVIVFVHGIFGDGVSTWTNDNGKYWPDLIAKDQSFNGADIFVYSYPTSLWATMSIDELAENAATSPGAQSLSPFRDERSFFDKIDLNQK